MQTAVTGVPRTLLRAEGLVMFVAATIAYQRLGGSWGTFALLFLLPDIAMLGYLAGPRVGAASYNALHVYVGPAVLAGAALFGLAPSAWPFALIWAAHIGFDRALGYGLKFGTAFRDSHLGIVGRPV